MHGINATEIRICHDQHEFHAGLKGFMVLGNEPKLVKLCFFDAASMILQVGCLAQVFFNPLTKINLITKITTHLYKYEMCMVTF